MSKNDKVREFVKQLKNNAELLLPFYNNNDCEAYTFVQNKETIYIDKFRIIIKYDSENDLIKVFSEELIEELIKKLKKEISNWFINISKEIKSGNYDQNSLIEPLLFSCSILCSYSVALTIIMLCNFIPKLRIVSHIPFCDKVLSLYPLSYNI